MTVGERNKKMNLTGVPETMLQTIYARAKESKGRGAICDKKAEEIVSRLDYDFSLADKDTAMHSGVIARTIVLDRLTTAWLATHPGGVEIKEKNVPVLVIIEGLTMYLSEADVQRIFAVISGRFQQATVFVEIMNPMIVKRFKEKSIDASNAKFVWGAKNGAAFAKLMPDFQFREEHSLTEGMAAFAPIYKLLDKLPFVRNISNKIIILDKQLSGEKTENNNDKGRFSS